MASKSKIIHENVKKFRYSNFNVPYNCVALVFILDKNIELVIALIDSVLLIKSLRMKITTR